MIVTSILVGIAACGLWLHGFFYGANVGRMNLLIEQAKERERS